MFEWVEQQPLLLSLFFILFVTIYVLKLTTSQKYRKLKLPPSPSKLPIIGNLHQLGLLPHRSLQSLAKQYGPLMLLRLGQTPTLIVSSVDAAREIFKTQEVKFLDRPKRKFTEKLSYSYKDLAFAPYGHYWKQVRKISASHLFSSQRVASFRTHREEEANLMVDKIRHLSSTSSSIGVNLSELVFSFTNNVVCRVTMGRKFGADEGGMKFKKMIAGFMYFVSVFNVEDFIPWLFWVNIVNGLNARAVKTYNEMDEFLEKVIQEHIQSRKKDKKGVEDFVDVLLELEQNGSMGGVPFDNGNIKAIILDMFAAGTETSLTTVVWAMTELIQQADIMKEVQMEIRDVAKGKGFITEDDLEKMHYMKMVIKETLRLHIPGPFLVPRESIQDAKIHGYDIPANTTVIVNAWAIARDPLYWEYPEKFIPKRFLNSSVDYKGQDFQFIPFGAGRRACPAINFAIPDMELPLANLLYHFDWTLPNGTTIKELDVTEEFSATAYKKHPLILVATPHNFE
ncbi:hypothetical protein AQUCO_01200264v1 [Aquilegia coerulea]|uniref:Cytochrome P450 n=1 Tax=Aquilegia coerulea TaxID=218851 RepID=A0A2G5E531_AQUCA|nr:hypothetical protein AQUCO_01200264v1 [Aquilegia coerulea]